MTQKQINSLFQHNYDSTSIVWVGKVYSYLGYLAPKNIFEELIKKLTSRIRNMKAISIKTNIGFN